MSRKRMIILTVIFLGAALIGRQHQIQQQQERPKAKSEAAPGVRARFAETETAPQVAPVVPLELMNASIQRLNSKMPSKQELQALGEHELHHMPPSIAEISEDLGAIKQLITDYPEDSHIIGQAVAFYRSCSAQVHWPSSVRALCLANLHEVAGESLDSAPVELYRLARLAAELPES